MAQKRGGYAYRFTFTGIQFGMVLLGLGTIFALSFALGYVLGEDAGEGRARLAARGDTSIAAIIRSSMGERTVELPREGGRPSPAGKEAPAGPAGEKLTFFRTLPDPPGASPGPPPGPRDAAERAAPPGPAPSLAAPAARATAAREFVVQVGSLKDAANADALKESLKRKGYPAFVVRADLGEKGVWHRVRVGPYAERAPALAALVKLKVRERIAGATLHPE